MNLTGSQKIRVIQYFVSFRTNKIHVQKNGRCINADLYMADWIYLQPCSLLAVHTVRLVIAMLVICRLRAAARCSLCVCSAASGRGVCDVRASLSAQGCGRGLHGCIMRSGAVCSEHTKLCTMYTIVRSGNLAHLHKQCLYDRDSTVLGY